MGGVSISAGYYLMAKLGMHLMFEFPASEYFDMEQIEVRDGLIIAGRLPRSRMFLWRDPKKERDIIVFIGEAQPPARGVEFCRRLLGHALELGVRKVFTFAAMATPMRPEQPSRIFGAAIDPVTLTEFRKQGVEILESGNINGLNGVLLAMASYNGMTGGCLLGEIPHVFSQIPFPKASLAVLDFFTKMAGIPLDLAELRTQAKKVEMTLEDFLRRMEKSMGEGPLAIGEEEDDEQESPPQQVTGAKERQAVEELLKEARRDRSRAYSLKQELDRLGLFSEYEDKFLDLFKEAD
jgi:proteasome assembly chaperone (PAC2) family protein